MEFPLFTSHIRGEGGDSLSLTMREGSSFITAPRDWPMPLKVIGEADTDTGLQLGKFQR